MRNEQPSKFTWIYAAGAVILVLIAIFAVTFAFQAHNDRVLTDQINGTAWELQDAGARITGIRDADMKDMNDYIRAYSQMEPLLNEYDRHLRESRIFTTKLAKGTMHSLTSNVFTVGRMSRTGKTCRRFWTLRMR